ncbi:MAG: hypothetical protein LBS52_03885 [Dysgonamonadaceae bacterium]|nr:hypothetical protein [Dysgonamonadaceae bacterium]
MKYTEINYPDLFVKVKLSQFDKEYHAIIEGNNTRLNAATQYANMENAVGALQNELPVGSKLIFKRYFVSDAINHAPLLPISDTVTTSIVQQPPLNGTKVTLWAYFVENSNPHYKHIFHTQLHNHSEDEFTQTEEIFEAYHSELKKQRLSLADNCIRTWIFVQGVDTHYAGMVKARKLHFYKQGLTEHTHYIASTGIEGKYLHPGTTVLMDAYAISGIVPEQITYIKGASHFSPTHKYGVTFERATAVDYGDRRHIFVSGTASIDNKGQIVFPLDIVKQVERTLENISVLLAEGGAEMTDMAQLIVYLRDTADYAVVSDYLDQHLPAMPKVIVWAPVCRPGWLVEMECIAVKAADNADYEVF